MNWAGRHGDPIRSDLTLLGTARRARFRIGPRKAPRNPGFRGARSPLRYPLASRRNWVIDPLKRFWSPGRLPPLSYCQNVQKDHPAGNGPELLL